MPKMVPLKSAMVLTLAVALLAFLAGSYNAPVPAQAQAPAQAPIQWKVQRLAANVYRPGRCEAAGGDH